METLVVLMALSGSSKRKLNSFSGLSANAKVTSNKESGGTTIGSLVWFISLSGSPKKKKIEFCEWALRIVSD